MAHNLMMINSKAAYAGRLAAWHNLGQVIGHCMTWQEAMSQAGLELTDLLTDLRHFADRSGIDFAACMRMSEMHHEAERENKD